MEADPRGRCGILLIDEMNLYYADPYYTDRLVHDVGTAAYFDTDGDFDTPQLNNIYESDPFLHDGRCYSLEEIWTRYNQDDLHGAANDLTMQQLNDLIEYLKSF